MLQYLDPPGSPPAIGPFSQGVIAQGRLLFVSGQGPQDPETGAILNLDFESEVRLTLANVERVLRAAGTGWPEVARVQVYLRDAARFAEFNTIYAELLGSARPARTTIICGLLAGIQVEVDCVAVVAAPGA